VWVPEENGLRDRKREIGGQESCQGFQRRNREGGGAWGSHYFSSRHPGSKLTRGGGNLLSKERTLGSRKKELQTKEDYTLLDSWGCPGREEVRDWSKCELREEGGTGPLGKARPAFGGSARFGNPRTLVETSPEAHAGGSFPGVRIQIQGEFLWGKITPQAPKNNSRNPNKSFYKEAQSRRLKEDALRSVRFWEGKKNSEKKRTPEKNGEKGGKRKACLRKIDRENR